MSRILTDEQRLKKIRAFARKRFPIEQDAEDFVQDFFLTKLEGKDKPLFVLYVDWCRKNFGRKGNRKFTLLNPKQIQNIEDTSTSPAFIDTTKLDGLERALFILKVNYGFKNIDLADIFGVSYDEICHIFREMLRRHRIPQRIQRKVSRRNK